MLFRWVKGVAGGESLGLQLADGSILLCELLQMVRGAFPKLTLRVFVTPQCFHFGKLGFGEGLLFPEVRQNRLDRSDFLFRAIVSGTGLFQSGGGIPGLFVCRFRLAQLSAGYLRFGACTWPAGGEKFIVSCGNLFPHPLVVGGLHDGGKTFLLESLDQRVLVIAGMSGGIRTGTSLPNP